MSWYQKIELRVVAERYLMTCFYYNDVIMGPMASQITSLSLFTQPVIQAQINENVKASRPCLCEGNSPMTREFPSQRASDAENLSM